MSDGSLKERYAQSVMPTYGRFDLELVRGAGSEVWDRSGRRFLDLGGGIAVNCLGHCHPELAETMAEQARRLNHVSNLYLVEEQVALAESIVDRLAPGRVFFCNSGAESNEGLIKFARRLGHETGRYEILTARNSFHGRTLATIAATGQDKVKQGFGPQVEGFRHVPFNDLAAFESAISPATIALLIEGVQGEGGLTPATPEFLMGLRRLCDERGLALMIDAVQCGHYRTGRYQSFQRILDRFDGGEGFLPDALSMAKSMGGGFPIGAFWVREAHADLLGPGSHGTTYGGNAMGCAIAGKILEIIDRDGLEARIGVLGSWLATELEGLVAAFPEFAVGVRGLGLMRGVRLNVDAPFWARADAQTPASIQVVQGLHERGILTIPAGPEVVRFLPAYNVEKNQLEEGLDQLRALFQTWKTR